MNESPLSDFPVLSFLIDEVASAMFADWLDLVKQQSPHRLNRQKVADYNLTTDVRQAFLNAWQAIVDKEYYKRNDVGWCKGFLLGFVQSVVSVHWSNEFLEPNLAQKNAYWLKAVILYLDSYEEARLHVNRLYLRLLDEDNSTLKTDDDRMAHRLVSDLQANENWQQARLYLNEHMVADITVAVQSEKGIDLGQLDPYFTERQLTELVNINPYL